MLGGEGEGRIKYTHGAIENGAASNPHHMQVSCTTCKYPAPHAHESVLLKVCESCPNIYLAIWHSPASVALSACRLPVAAEIRIPDDLVILELLGWARWWVRGYTSLRKSRVGEVFG